MNQTVGEGESHISSTNTQKKKMKKNHKTTLDNPGISKYSINIKEIYLMEMKVCMVETDYLIVIQETGLIVFML